jgi:Type II secretory pathway, component PulF
MLGDLNRRFIRMQFGKKARIRVYRKIARFIANSMTLTQALETLYDHASEGGKKPTRTQAIVINEWLREVRNGKPFGRAIQGWVPESDRLVIEGGDAHGKLGIALENAIMISEASGRIRSAIIAGMAYPILIICALINFLWTFANDVIPAFEQTIPVTQWTGVAYQMAVMAEYIRNHLGHTIIAIIALLVLAFWSMPRWTGKLRVHFDRFPPWSLYRLVIGSGFLLSVAGMVKAGLPIPEILRKLQRDAAPWYLERLRATLRHVENGNNLGESLHMSGFDFPDRETVYDLRAYASLNKFDETLERLGVEWLEESVAKVNAQMAVFRNLSILLLGGVVGWLFMGIFTLQQMITSSM